MPVSSTVRGSEWELDPLDDGQGYKTETEEEEEGHISGRVRVQRELRRTSDLSFRSRRSRPISR